MSIRRLGTLLVIMAVAAAPIPGHAAAFPYQDPSLPVATRVADLLSRMSLDEKLGQMTQAERGSVTAGDITTYRLGSILSGGGSAPSPNNATSWANMYDSFQQAALGTPLGIPMIYGVDAVHGHSNVYGATIFPHNIGLGATRDPALVQQIGQAVAEEVSGTGIDWNFAPCLCVARDDRWGRTYESFGEVPEIAGSMTTFINGLQGTTLNGPASVLATAKHYLGDGGTTAGDDQGNTQLTEAQLRAIHLPPFQAAVNRGAGSVMISYSSWNGQKVHGDRYLITDVLKGELGFAGFVVSDWAGVKQLPEATYADQVARAVNAGIDMIMVPDNYAATINAIVSGVTGGRIPQARIDDAVTRILNAKFALDLFNHPYTDRSYTGQVGSAAHRAVAREAVRKSLVLLKNDGGALPLPRTGPYSIVIGGKSADDLGNQSGGWSISWQGASGTRTTGSTFWQGLQRATAGTGITVQNVGTRTKGRYRADVGIWIGGETPYAEGRGDSSTLAFGSDNAAQLGDICSRVTTCIAILYSGRPLIIGDQLPKADAFVAGWLPGTEGDGVTDVLFGAGFSGKLPVSWPRAVTDEPINSGDGKTPLFPLGYGITPY